MSKENIPKGVRNEFDDVDYWHKLPKNKFVELPDGTKISIYEYMKKFMHEAYANNFSRSEPETNILQTEEHKKWARRNNNNTNRDALLVSKKMGAMNTLFQIERGAYDTDPEPWEDNFKAGTYETSLHSLIEQSCEEVGISFSKLNARVIFKIYFRINKFIKMVRKDQRNKK